MTLYHRFSSHLFHLQETEEANNIAIATKAFANGTYSTLVVC